MWSSYLNFFCVKKVSSNNQIISRSLGGIGIVILFIGQKCKKEQYTFYVFIIIELYFYLFLFMHCTCTLYFLKEIYLENFICYNRYNLNIWIFIIGQNGHLDQRLIRILTWVIYHGGHLKCWYYSHKYKFFSTSFLSCNEPFKLINDAWLVRRNGRKTIYDQHVSKIVNTTYKLWQIYNPASYFWWSLLLIYLFWLIVGFKIWDDWWRA